MADKTFTSGSGSNLPERWIDNGDGTFSRRYSVALSASDRTALDKAGAVYRRAASVGATAGDGLIVTGVTTAGTVTITLAGGGSLTVSVPLGSTILPFAATAAALGTAVGGSFQSLFFS